MPDKAQNVGSSRLLQQIFAGIISLAIVGIIASGISTRDAVAVIQIEMAHDDRREVKDEETATKTANTMADIKNTQGVIKVNMKEMEVNQKNMQKDISEVKEDLKEVLKILRK